MLGAAALNVTVVPEGGVTVKKESIKSQIPQHAAGATEQLHFNWYFGTRVN